MHSDPFFRKESPIACLRNIAALAALAAVIVAGCGGGAQSSPASGPLANVPGIVDPGNTGWPRSIQTKSGRVEIKSPPQRILPLTVGDAETTFALVGPSRIAAVGEHTVNPLYSNVSGLAQRIALKVRGEAEEIIRARPDLVVASAFTQPELVQQIRQAGITVALVDPQDSLDDLENNVRLLAYVYGETDKGERLIAEVRRRLKSITDVTSRKSPAERPRVLFWSGWNYTPGSGTNVDLLIRLAGAINVAAETGIDGWKQLGIETIAALRPDYIVVHSDLGPELRNVREELLKHPGLVEVPAIKQGRVIALPGRYFGTLSQWNVRGVEELARVLWPEEFKGLEFKDFSYEGW